MLPSVALGNGGSGQTGVHNLQQFPAAVCTKLEAVFKELGWKGNPHSLPGTIAVRCPVPA